MNLDNMKLVHQIDNSFLSFDGKRKLIISRLLEGIMSCVTWKCVWEKKGCMLIQIKGLYILRNRHNTWGWETIKEE